MVFQPATVSTTLRPDLTTRYDRSILDWPPLGPGTLDDYADSVDINFQSAIYDDDEDIDNLPDASYDLDDKRSRTDEYGVSEGKTELAPYSSTPLKSTRQTELKVPAVHERLQRTSSTAATSSATWTTRNDEYLVVSEAKIQRTTPSSGGGGSGGVQNYAVLLTILTILATVAVVVVVIVAMVMMANFLIHPVQ